MGGEAQPLACNGSSGYNFYKGTDTKYAAGGTLATGIAQVLVRLPKGDANLRLVDPITAVVCGPER